MRILFVSANPDWTPRLDLLDELRELKQGLKGKHYELELLPAAQPDDLREAVDSSDKPIDIVHFSGHATEKHGLLFAKVDGKKQALTAEQLNEVFAEKPVKLAVLNACHTKSTAEGIQSRSTDDGITGFANTVIGTSKRVQDKAAKKMTKVLYSSLAQDKSVDEAYAAATKAIVNTGLENVYMTSREAGTRAPELTFGAGDVQIDEQNQENWDRYFYEAYLDEQIEAQTEALKEAEQYRQDLLTLGLAATVTLLIFARTDLLQFLNWGLVNWETLTGQPFAKWLATTGPFLPTVTALIQGRSMVHKNDRLRSMKRLKEMVKASDELSPQLRDRLHSIMNQAILGAGEET